MVITPTCDCRRGFRKNGALAWVHHSSADCPGNVPPPPPPPRTRVQTEYDIHASLRKAFRQLKHDLAAVDGNLDAPSKRDWPPNCDIVSAELSLREQFQLLHWRAARLVQQGNFAAEPLRRRVAKVLEIPARAGFIAPQTFPTSGHVIMPPPAIAAALERLRPVTPFGAALASPQPGDTLTTADDRWRVSLWAAEIQD